MTTTRCVDGGVDGEVDDGEVDDGEVDDGEVDDDVDDGDVDNDVPQPWRTRLLCR